MSEQDNVAILKKAYQLWSAKDAGSVAHWLNIIADDVNWRSLGDGAPGMEFTSGGSSKADVEGYFAALAEEWEMIHYTVDQYIAQGDQVVVVGNCAWRSTKTGTVVSTPKADIIKMKDSKIVEFFEFFDTAKALAATG